jgi:hypothetical protein
MDYETRKAVDHARKVTRDCEAARSHLRRRTRPGEENREARLALYITALHDAMAPIRSQIGKIPYGSVAPRDEVILRDVSKRLKYERKQLRKMQRG